MLKGVAHGNIDFEVDIAPRRARRRPSGCSTPGIGMEPQAPCGADEHVESGVIGSCGSAISNTRAPARLRVTTAAIVRPWGPTRQPCPVGQPIFPMARLGHS